MTSGEPSAGRPPVLRALPILATLAAHEVEFVVIGGFSLAAHGFVRGTKDVDIVPRPARENLERLMSALAEMDSRQRGLDDFRLEELPVPLTTEGLCQGGNWFLETKFGWLDVLQSVEGAAGYEELHARSVERSLPGVPKPISFAGRDDLVVMKRAAGRPQDLVDLQRLEETEGT